jgi:hypothetical protein
MVSVREGLENEGLVWRGMHLNGKARGRDLWLCKFEWLDLCYPKSRWMMQGEDPFMRII